MWNSQRPEITQIWAQIPCLAMILHEILLTICSISSLRHNFFMMEKMQAHKFTLDMKTENRKT